MLSGASRTTLDKVFPMQCCPRRYSWDNIAQMKTLCSVVREATNNIEKEKILCNDVLTLLEQHYTDKNRLQTKMHRKVSYSILP